MAPHTRIALLLLTLSACSAALAQPWPNCPLTGLPPTQTTATWTRCMDASKYACCQDCSDIANGLALVSSNVSNFLQYISPLLLPFLKGQDINFCTAVYPSATCQDTLEQLACAITCNPNSGNYISINATSRILYLCDAFAKQLQDSCHYAQVTGTTSITNQTFFYEAINPKYFLQALANGVTGILNITRFQIVTSNNTEGFCYGGPVAAPAHHLCCDDLTPSTTCPAGAVDLNLHPNWAPNTGREVSNSTCREADPYPIAPLAPLAPPPPSPPFSLTGHVSNTNGTGLHAPPPAQGSNTTLGTNPTSHSNTGAAHTSPTPPPSAAYTSHAPITSALAVVLLALTLLHL